MNVSPKHIALFGGSFDPPHVGHLLIAEAAVSQCNLDRVIFIPCQQSPHKQNQIPLSGDLRLELLSLCIENLAWAEASDIEIRREGLSYSIETIRHYREKYDNAKLYWLMGSDQWEVLETWKSYEAIADLVEFIVFPRPAPPKPMQGLKAHFMSLRIDISSSEIRKSIRAGVPEILAIPEAIREKVISEEYYKNFEE